MTGGAPRSSLPGTARPQFDYEALLAGLPDAVVGIDEALRVVLWNPAAEELFGRSARRAVGRTLKETFPADTSLVRHLADTLATGESRSESEAAVEAADGRLVHVSIVTAPLAGRRGPVEAAVAVIRDISRLRQLESEVRRGETLAAAGRMAVGLAHEIRNPLSAIRGAVQLMQRELGDEARWGEYTDVLLKEVGRVNRIIEMLLDLGRPVSLRLVPLNVHQLLERVALLSQELAAERRVQIVRRYDPSLPPILADEDRIAPGAPQPRAQRHRGHARRRPRHAGLPAQHEPAVRQGRPRDGAAHDGRDPGRRRGPGPARGHARQAVHARSSPPRTRGSASGLPSATASSRSTRARSSSPARPGRAPTVTCFIPIARCRRDAATACRRRILIADDEDSLRWVLEKGFRGAGYQVTAVKDGTAALREAEAETFDLVLLDVRMPGIDGLSLLEMLKDRRPDAQVVIMTAHGTMETAVQAMQKGAYDYLAKPFDLDEALLLAERALTARRLTQEVASLAPGSRRSGSSARWSAVTPPCRRSTRPSAASRAAT